MWIGHGLRYGFDVVARSATVAAAMADEHHHAPGLPEIHDEAADTPMWLPMLGLAIFAIVALFLITRAAIEDASAELDATAEEAPADAPAEAPSEAQPAL